jgi:phosphonate transport system ATP-binding protein
MSAGAVVFDGAPEALTGDAARDLYGLEAGEVMDLNGAIRTAPDAAAPAAAAVA